ncbi:MAG: SDR family oxidoreductase [Chloroflexi bacterium]|nr:SDR family oxidoreductase [Chloroflexota bacterium]
MQAFVTGSTGLLGSNLVRLLLDQGYDVKALARSGEKAERLLGDTRAQIVVGDMLDVDGFAGELAGCDVLFHTAAYFREYYQRGDHWPMLDAVNIKGTIRLLEAAERHGVAKAIHTSSASVIARGSNGTPSDESSPYSHLSEVSLYAKSKKLAEQAIFEFLKTHDLPVVLVLPGWILGPSDAAPTTSGQMVLDYLAGKLRIVPPGGLRPTDARDVAQAMINAVEHGQSGERYIVSGDLIALNDVFQVLEKVTGIPAPTRKIPFRVLLVIAWVAQNAARFTGRQPLTTVNAVRTIYHQHPVSSRRAERELSLTLRPLADTLRDEVNWFRAHGYLAN